MKEGVVSGTGAQIYLGQRDNSVNANAYIFFFFFNFKVTWFVNVKVWITFLHRQWQTIIHRLEGRKVQPKFQNGYIKQ